MNFRRGKHYKKLLFFIVDFYTNYIIIPKPHFSSREGIISRCRFDLLHFPVLAQSDAARPSLYIIAVVAAHVRLVQQPSSHFPLNLAKYPQTRLLLILVEEVV